MIVRAVRGSFLADGTLRSHGSAGSTQRVPVLDRTDRRLRPLYRTPSA